MAAAESEPGGPAAVGGPSAAAAAAAAATAAVVVAAISTEPIGLDAHVAAVSGPDAGAVATFLGTVRHADPDAAGEVVALEYTAHPDAEATLRRIAEEVVAESLPGASAGGAAPSGGAVAGSDPAVRVAVSHRVGRLGIGDAAVVIAVASGHRAEAFDVCRGLIERIKSELPVWKRQVEADGTTAWKGLGG